MASEVRKLKSGRLAGLQLLVLTFCLITISMYISSIPRYYKALISTCIAHGCGNSVPAMPIPEQGLTLEHYALLFVLIDCVFTFVFYATSAAMLWKGFREPMGLLAAAAMVSFGTSFPSLTMVASEGSFLAYHWFMMNAMLGWITLSLFFFLFPDGFFVPRWTRFVFFLIVVVDVLQFAYSGRLWTVFNVPEYVRLLWYVGSTVILIYSQVYRFRKVSGAVQRQQTKWVVYGVAIGFVGFLGMSVLFYPGFNDGSAITYVYLNAILNLSLTAIPITLMMAILRQRLWNIDPLVRRTLVYAALSVCVVLLYTMAVLYLSRLFQTKDNFIISLLATAVVAVAFAPLKEWLQRQINRLMKGRHDDPYAVLLELGNQLIQPLAPEAMLDAVVRTVKDALRLTYTAIAIGVGGQEKTVASAGERVNEVHAFPIIHRGEELGTLYIASRSPGEGFSAEDHKFLDVLLRQAGPIVENVNMTLGMKLLAKDLQESREKLVLAREEERRQIRKNLHDDLAPRLAALALNAATAQKYVEKEPATAIDMLADLRRVIRSTVSEIRVMVHDLRPPTLDELGLVGAIQERIHELSKPAQLLAEEQGTEPLRIALNVPLPLPPLPAAVEVAAYRIVTESVVNVVKHAQATACTVRLNVDSASQLIVEITDNGLAGSARASAAAAAFVAGQGGIGQQSIRERAAELGGQCLIERLEQGGTRVFAVLPL
ncbi:Histidine kinase-, DNA gyrase B-, and HSP90-like ATPase [Paenibacillus sp. UNCCL117]|uniref:GAF domain-containing sensor histidine kinase n=1 Tax=unclassified Paenibacillus TaxID=185978 RepID=UPI0008894185|nr:MULTISPECIES: histidine kinase [unclassified Paenibacillus]SDD82985.1 Histidine kinase-, DNA gyrase B-, and HSP90-like ATPase [Paenibacillus sp. cl123]SFW54987.1 Histidine kinase-, DNA gyrase B-, and HSP90-like ATPase [Paenibacillus sp. UNCCL117]